jgi:hypothetical protein
MKAARSIRLALSVLAIGLGVTHAVRLAWITDDAWISFRYAENLMAGHGLVFNAGERVEGYSNFLWTLWSALGIAIGQDPAAWATGWSITAYAATLGLLAAFSWRTAGASAAPVIPLAALLMALHRDAAVFATSGLETASFTLLAVASYGVMFDAPGHPRRLVLAGTLFALAALSRPDGILLGIVAGLWLLVESRRRMRDALVFAAPLVALLLPYAVWKLAYYGDLFPNTYYAKSAYRPWYEQGWHYSRLYFEKYWLLALGVVGLIPAGAIGQRDPRADGNSAPDSAAAIDDARWRREVGLAAALGLAYVWYVTHVGGDFMFARLLIPATPFLLVVFERVFVRLAPRQARGRWAVAAGCALALVATPYPFTGQGWVHGIVDEWKFYSEPERVRSRAFGRYLRDLFDGLPVRMAFCGGQAVLAYHSQVPLAIETATGLTDAVIARQPLEARGRVGHEKKTPIPYLIERRTHFWMYSGSLLSDSLATYIPLVPIQLDTLTVMAITWDPAVMRALRERGAQVPDFEATLDQLAATLPALGDDEARMAYEKARRFYFDHVDDPAREAPFRERLQASRAPARGLATP